MRIEIQSNRHRTVRRLLGPSALTVQSFVLRGEGFWPRARRDKALRQKDRRPMGCAEKGPGALLLLSHRALRLCSFVAPPFPPVATTQRTPIPIYEMGSNHPRHKLRKLNTPGVNDIAHVGKADTPILTDLGVAFSLNGGKATTLGQMSRGRDELARELDFVQQDIDVFVSPIICQSESGQNQWILAMTPA